MIFLFSYLEVILYKSCWNSFISPQISLISNFLPSQLSYRKVLGYGFYINGQGSNCRAIHVVPESKTMTWTGWIHFTVQSSFFSRYSRSERKSNNLVAGKSSNKFSFSFHNNTGSLHHIVGNPLKIYLRKHFDNAFDHILIRFEFQLSMK